MISLDVRFDKKGYNKTNDLKNVIERLQKLRESMDSPDTAYICADTLNNCIWVCSEPSRVYQVLLS